MPENEKQNSDEAPLEDLKAKEIAERDAEQVKGGKVVPNDFNFVVKVDKASPTLIQ